jgi:hypothetical protein
LVATPLYEESLRASQGDRLSEAHDADERSNICVALPNSLAKVRLGVREKDWYFYSRSSFPKHSSDDCIRCFMLLNKKPHIAQKFHFLQKRVGIGFYRFAEVVTRTTSD